MFQTKWPNKKFACWKGAHEKKVGGELPPHNQRVIYQMSRTLVCANRKVSQRKNHPHLPRTYFLTQFRGVAFFQFVSSVLMFLYVLMLTIQNSTIQKIFWGKNYYFSVLQPKKVHSEITYSFNYDQNKLTTRNKESGTVELLYKNEWMENKNEIETKITTPQQQRTNESGRGKNVCECKKIVFFSLSSSLAHCNLVQSLMWCARSFQFNAEQKKWESMSDNLRKIVFHLYFI